MGADFAEQALARCDARFAQSWWHWFFLGNPAARAHEVISADPDFWYRTADKRAQMGEAWAEWHAAVHDPATVQAMCEDYRAGLAVDRAHDDADRAAGRRLRCPTRVGWALQDDMEELYGNPLDVWAAWADDLSGVTFDCGHHIAEERPEELGADLRRFLG